MAICTAACMSVTAFAANATNIYADDTAQAEVYQSTAYLEALDALKSAEQEFIEQEALANAEETVSHKAVEDDIIVTSDKKLSDASPTEDHAPIIGEFVPNPYWEALEALKLADIHYKEICSTLGVSGKYSSILDVNKDQDSVAVTYPSYRRLPIRQYPQEHDYWCGYAAIQSLLDYEEVYMTQEEIANKVYSPDKDCPWYTVDGKSIDQYPVPKVLKELTGFYYVPYPTGGAGANVLTESDIKSKILSTINYEHGV